MRINAVAPSARPNRVSMPPESVGTLGDGPPAGVNVVVGGTTVGVAVGAGTVGVEVGVGVWIEETVSKDMSSTAKSFPSSVGVLSKSSSETVVLAPEFHTALTGVHIPTPVAE